MAYQKWLSFDNHKCFRWKWMKALLYSNDRIGRWQRWSGRHCWQYWSRLMSHPRLVRWGSKNCLQNRNVLSQFLWWNSNASTCHFCTLTRLFFYRCKVESKSKSLQGCSQDSRYQELTRSLSPSKWLLEICTILTQSSKTGIFFSYCLSYRSNSLALWTSFLCTRLLNLLRPTYWILFSVLPEV